jgi:hypothetical protein
MERWLFAAVFGLFAISIAGCGTSDSPATSEAQRAEHGLDPTHLASGYSEDHQRATSAVADNLKNATPDKVLKQFLDAARLGDQKKLSTLMSKLAREEAEKYHIDFELQSYKDATYDLGQYEYLTPAKNTAHVACKWTDHDGDTNFTHDVIWVMRKEEEGWRVVGMITRPFPDRDPVAFNYENVKELMDTKAAIEDEVKRRAEEEERQARRAARKASEQK